MINDPKFYLVRPGNESTGIVCKISIDNNRFAVGTGESIYSELWDSKNCRPTKSKTLISKYRKKDPTIDATLENQSNRLDNFEKELLEFVNKEIEEGNKITSKLIKSFAKKDLTQRSKENAHKENTLNGFIDRYIKEIESGERTYIKKEGGTSINVKFRKSSIKSKKSWQRLWKEFQKDTRKKYDFEDIDMNFYQTYKAYYFDKEYTANTFGKMVKELKTILNAAYWEKLHTNQEYNNPKFTMTKYDSTEVYLSRNEVDRLYNLDLSENPNHEIIRDIFLIGCYTALRFSDYSRINIDHIFDNLTPDGSGIKVLKLRTKKTGTEVNIPLSPDAITILKRHDFTLPKTYEHKVNKAIKEICELAKINEPVEVRSVVSGEQKVEFQPKYKLVKTHTARRTGATLMYKAGIPSLSIMMITGHKTETNFMKYIKVGKEENALMLAQNSFFQNTTTKKEETVLTKVN